MAAHTRSDSASCCGWMKFEIVGRSVILRKGSPNAPHQAADREIEARRAVLPLVIAVGRELQNLRRFAAVAQNMRRRPVNLGISPAALLVMESARVSDAGQHQSVADAPARFAVSREPGDGADRSGNKQKPIRVAKIPSGQKLRQKGGHGQPGEIVIRQRRMAGMTRNQDLVGRLRPADSTRRRSDVRLREWSRCSTSYSPSSSASIWLCDRQNPQFSL